MKSGTSTIDLFSDDVLNDPFAAYGDLRKTAGAVWLERHGMWAISRHADVMAVLQDHDGFSSASGVAFNSVINDMAGSTLTTDRPLHTALRELVTEQLKPAALIKLREKIDAEAALVVERLVAKRSFDAVTELAWHLPLSVVTDLVGVPRDMGKAMIALAENIADAFGPDDNLRTAKGLEAMAAAGDMLDRLNDPANLRPGSMSMAIWEAAERGTIEKWRAPLLMNDYIGPSLDTTISAIGSAIWLFAENPAEWDKLRADPKRVMSAIDEVIRLESPVQAFTRVALSDQVIDNVRIPAGDRVIAIYASANRDERKWHGPDEMDINRKGIVGHLGFGAGIHSCPGRNLARTEIAALLQALATKVARFHVRESKRRISNVMRGFSNLEVEVEPA